METERLKKEAMEKLLDLTGEVSFATLYYWQTEVQKVSKVK